MHQPYILVLCTVPNEETSEKISEALVKEALAACVTAVPGVKSVYSWKGEVQRDTEQMLYIKTKSELYRLTEARIKSLHPYDVPEIIALPISFGSEEYLDWIGRVTRSEL